MFYKVVRGMVPAINADELLISIRNKRHINHDTSLTFIQQNIVGFFFQKSLQSVLNTGLQHRPH